MPVQTRSRARKQLSGDTKPVSGHVGPTRFITPAPDTPKDPVVPTAPKKARKLGQRVAYQDSFAIPNVPPLIENDEETAEGILTPRRTLVFTPITPRSDGDSNRFATDLQSPFQSPQTAAIPSKDIQKTAEGARRTIVRHETFVTPEGRARRPESAHIHCGRRSEPRHQ